MSSELDPLLLRGGDGDGQRQQEEIQYVNINSQSLGRGGNNTSNTSSRPQQQYQSVVTQTYSAGEDVHRLAQAAKELGLKRFRDREGDF